MTFRALTLSLACLSALALSAPAPAQGLRTPGGSAARLPATLLPPAGTGSAAAAAGTAPRQADYIVAVVNSEPITNNEVRQRAARLQQQLAAQNVAAPPRDVLAREALERLVMERVQVQLARESGIKVDDWALNQAEQTVARQNDVSVEEMHRRLAADGVSPERFREELRQQLLALRVRERDVEARVRVSDLDVDQYLREQQQAAGGGRLELNLAHIFVRVPESATPVQAAEREKRAQEIRAQINAGGDFAQLAREYSDAPEGASGGELGLRPAERYPDLFVSATQSAPVGGVVGPVRSPAGYHILKVVDRSRAGVVAATAVESHARHILLRVQPGTTEAQAAERLEELRQRVVQGGADFAQLAREFSQDGSAKDGGDLGWALPGRFVPEFEQTLNGLAPGEVSQPVATRFGVHLIQLLGRREVKLNQRQQRDMVREAVREKKLDEAFSNWLRDARARAYVEYRDAPQL
ncbi:periplasmic chaperone for outer membrane proteins SurA [Oryzisolibacter propanilivorax]|uniref:Chaperone SurA n=1 Tax=Oryzisolibacter propanilivorax TaxID=1527607 RepID=A0A1G9QP00_9BURK|nr:peptidylprolyl isomerase [Oryzisolibacter propanilivorax]SDM12752.1 periplasmic chaperone for outer membrane proteins SurA [Oryzisolibacter propanilivorax]